MSIPTPADRKAAQQKAMVEALDLPAVMQLATRFYRSQLKSSTRAINYLKKRGLTGEVAARFGLGYAPDAWQSLESIFTDYPKNPALLESGLVIDNDSGRRYDRFRDRIMFPIVNQRGAIIGFGGRVLDSGEPKYLNSPETVLFEKGRELYGLYQARQAIRDAGKVIVVEGYMDVVSLAQFGVNYAVATLGTSTTPTHVQKLLRQTDRVVFCFDGDNAGRKAAWRALENALPFMQDGKALDFLFLPQDEDPDSYVRHFGKDRFEQLLSEDSVPLTGFLLSELASRVDMQSDSGRASLLHSAKPLLAQIAAPALNLMLRSRLAELVGVAQDELDRLFGIRKARSDKKMTAQPRTPRQPPSVTRQLLQWLLQYPQLATTLHLPESNQEEIAAISAVRQFCLDCDSAPSLGQIMESVRGTPAEQLVRQTARLLLEEAPVLSEEEAAQEMASLVERLQARLRSDQLEYLQRKAQQSGLTDEEKMQMLELLKR